MDIAFEGPFVGKFCSSGLGEKGWIFHFENRGNCASLCDN